LSTEAWHTETLTEGLHEGESLQPFVQAFDRWVTALGFHADMEDAYMTPLLPASATTRDNEAAHARLGQRVDTIRAYVQQLDDTVVTTRIRRHLFGKVVALRIDQDDHLEEEEAFVLPIIRERMLQAEQIDIAQRLLVDPQAQDTGWVLDWLVQDLTDTDRQALAALSTHFQPTLSRPEVTT
jgi:hypothetical protein